MRLCEFETSAIEGVDDTVLFAWARYKRGEVPEPGEYAYIDRRVKSKFPEAELVEMRRRFVPACPVEPTEVWWDFKWIVFNRKQGGAK